MIPPFDAKRYVDLGFTEVTIIQIENDIARYLWRQGFMERKSAQAVASVITELIKVMAPKMEKAGG